MQKMEMSRYGEKGSAEEGDWTNNGNCVAVTRSAARDLRRNYRSHNGCANASLEEEKDVFNMYPMPHNSYESYSPYRCVMP